MEKIVQSFKPAGDGVTGSVNVAITAASAQVAVPLIAGQRTLRLYNNGSNITFVCFGSAASAVAVAATSMPMAPNSIEVFTIPEDFVTEKRALYVAGIGTAGNTLYITPGVGA